MRGRIFDRKRIFEKIHRGDQGRKKSEKKIIFGGNSLTWSPLTYEHGSKL